MHSAGALEAMEGQLLSSSSIGCQCVCVRTCTGGAPLGFTSATLPQRSDEIIAKERKNNNWAGL